MPPPQPATAASQWLIRSIFLCPKQGGLETIFFGCKFLKASTERILLQKKEKLQLLWEFFLLKKLRNSWNRCQSLSEALPVLRCWGLLQILEFQGVPKSFQVSVTGDSPEGHVVLEWNQKSAGFFSVFVQYWDQNNFFSLYPQEQSFVLSQCQRQGDSGREEGTKGELCLLICADRKTHPPQFRSSLLHRWWWMLNFAPIFPSSN